MKREAKHFFIDVISSGSPFTFRYVSCWPAKLASAKSSVVAELLTATNIALGDFLRISYAGLFFNPKSSAPRVS